MNDCLGLFQGFTLPTATLLSYLVVPSPRVAIHSTHVDTAYAGRNETLRCEATLSGGVTVNDVQVNFTWMKNNSVISDPSVIDRIRVLQPMVNGSELQSKLVFSPLSSSLDNGTYKCVVNLTSQDKKFVVGAMKSVEKKLLVASKLVRGVIHYYSCK